MSASHCWQGDTPRALSDGAEVESLIDHSIPRFTWWDHRGTREWVQYEFRRPETVSAVEVYWFDDTGRGQCRVPRSWRLVYREGDEWREVAATGAYGVERDTYNRVTFDPVETRALRIEVELGEGVSGGILEWRVE